MSNRAQQSIDDGSMTAIWATHLAKIAAAEKVGLIVLTWEVCLIGECHHRISKTIAIPNLFNRLE